MTLRPPAFESSIPGCRPAFTKRRGSTDAEHPYRKHGRSSQTDVLREVGAQDLIELIHLVVAHTHEEESENRLARILDAAKLQRKRVKTSLALWSPGTIQVSDNRGAIPGCSLLGLVCLTDRRLGQIMSRLARYSGPIRWTGNLQKQKTNSVKWSSVR